MRRLPPRRRKTRYYITLWAATINPTISLPENKRLRIPSIWRRWMADPRTEFYPSSISPTFGAAESCWESDGRDSGLLRLKKRMPRLKSERAWSHTHLRLHPGEEIRYPGDIVAVLFGQRLSARTKPTSALVVKALYADE